MRINARGDLEYGGIRYHYTQDEEGNPVIVQTQEADPLLDHCSMLRSDESYSPSRLMRREFCLPLTTYYDLLTKGGEEARHNPNFWAKVANDRDWRRFRTSDGKT